MSGDQLMKSSHRLMFGFRSAGRWRFRHRKKFLRVEALKITKSLSVHNALRAMIDLMINHHESLYHFESLMMNADFLSERLHFSELKKHIWNS